MMIIIKILGGIYMNKNYVVIMLFNKNYNKVLLVKRSKNPYKGCWNGIGGKQKVVKLQLKQQEESAKKKPVFP